MKVLGLVIIALLTVKAPTCRQDTKVADADSNASKTDLKHDDVDGLT